MTSAVFDPAGEIAIGIAWDGERVRRVNVRSTRPMLAFRVLEGKRADDAVALVGLLFGVCRHAQRAAARAAIATADNDRFEAARCDEISVLLETLQEHLHHVAVDVPRSAGRAAVEAAVGARRRIDALLRAIERDGGVDAGALRAVAAAIDALATDEIYAMKPAEWLALDREDALRAWARRRTTLPAAMLDDLLCEPETTGRRDVALMPTPDRGALLSSVVPAMTERADFAREPTWAGAPVETGALARARAHPLVHGIIGQSAGPAAVRYVSRLVELAVLLARLNDPSDDSGRRPFVNGYAIGTGEGLGAVQTARGLLLHRARVDNDVVAAYTIVAPTDWNFHPDGAAARALASVAASSVPTLERRAAVTVKAFDPCVAYRIEVADA